FLMENRDRSIAFFQLECPGVQSALKYFFHATKLMEEEVMLPTRLKDLASEKYLLQNESSNCNICLSPQLLYHFSATGMLSDQPSCHELFYFIQRIRDHLRCMKPFMSEENNPKTTTVTDSNKVLLELEEEEPQTFCENEGFNLLLSQLTSYYYGLVNILKYLAHLAQELLKTKSTRDK
ncbi:unnamed protein product, partial [Didymodactylos carnosus]